LPPSSPGERDPKAPARVTPVPIETVPPLPWRPRLEDHVFRDPIWLLLLFFVAGTVFQLVHEDHVAWWQWTAPPALLFSFWVSLKIAFEQLTLGTDGIVIRGPLLRRRYSWKAVDGVRRRGKKKVVLDLGHRGTRTFEFDGKDGTADPDHVAAVVERLRGYNTSALTSYRVSLSWGAAVFLPAVAAVVAATAWALIKG
jgi:hypothetical protein